MRKIFISILLAAVATGCSNQATKTASEPAAVAPTAIMNKMHGPTTGPKSLESENPLAKRDVYFDFDNSEISDEGRALLKLHTKYLMEHAATKVEVEGNTDERGSVEYNIGLGERRAINVKKFLVASGISDSRIAVISYGKERPVATCHEESCWKQNRRADIKY